MTRRPPLVGVAALGCLWAAVTQASADLPGFAPAARSRSAGPGRPDGVELTHFRGHCSPEEGGVHDAEESTAQTIRNWLAQADRDAGQRPDGLTTDEREELRRLRRENKTLREAREILKKAAAWFAKETCSIPPKDSSS